MTHSHDPEALSLHLEWTQRLARRLLRDPHAAEDLVQDTWVAALRRPPARHWAARRWLGGVMRNLARTRGLRSARREDRERHAARPEGVEASSSVHERAEAHRQLIDAVMGLDEAYRDVVLLRYFDSLSTEEIAKQLDVNPSTVRSRLHRAVERLRGELGRDGRLDRTIWSLGMGIPGARINARASGALGVVPCSLVAGLLLLAGWAWQAWGAGAPRPHGTQVASFQSVGPVLLGTAEAVDLGVAPAIQDPSSGERTRRIRPPIQRAAPRMSQEPEATAVGDPPAEVAVLQVLGVNGQPSSHVRVRYRHASEAPKYGLGVEGSWFDRFPHNAATDATGRVELPWVNEVITALVMEDCALGFAQVEARFDPRRPTPLLQLQPDGNLEVEVVDARGQHVRDTWVYMGFEARLTDERGVAAFEHARGALASGGPLHFHLGLFSPTTSEEDLLRKLETWPAGGRIRLVRPPVGYIHLRCLGDEDWEGAQVLTHAPIPGAPGIRIRDREAVVQVGAGLPDVPIHLLGGLGRTAIFNTPGPAEDETISLELTPESRPRWVVQALDPSGRPIAAESLKAELSHPSHNASFTVMTDVSGQFGVAVPNHWAPDAAPSMLRLSRGRGAHFTIGNLELHDPKRDPESTVVVRLEDRSVLAGRVRDPDGRTIPDLSIIARFVRRDAGRDRSRPATSNRAPLGDFVVNGPMEADERILLRLGAPGFQTTEVTLEASTDVQLTLLPDVKFRAELLLDEGFDQDQIEWTLTGPGGFQSRFNRVSKQGITVSELPTGTYTLTLTDRDTDRVLRRIDGIELNIDNPKPDPRLNPIDLRGAHER